ncbi:MAG TPA: lysozyme inhibitor LprI family protein, partial [Bdellovibrionota bacterium]|nr:lysozyme inhibitor LprI family protein [Bdellovibrionota bacterium]
MKTLIALLSLLPCAAQAASFDCLLAKSSVERTICTDRALSALDSRLGAAFGSALEAAPAGTRVRLRAEQKSWIEGRNAKCGALTGQDEVLCLTQEMNGRIQFLKGVVTVPTARVHVAYFVPADVQKIYRSIDEDKRLKVSDIEWVQRAAEAAPGETELLTAARAVVKDMFAGTQGDGAQIGTFENIDGRVRYTISMEPWAGSYHLTTAVKFAIEKTLVG